MIRRTAILAAVLTAGIVGYGFYDASRPVDVYAPAADYVVTRPVHGPADMDKVQLTARVRKLIDCEVERGDGPVWVDFYDGSAVAPPPSAFFRPDGYPAGTTLLRAGETMVLEGYSAVVPYRLRGLEGTFVVRIPCQLWTPGADGERVYGRKVVAAYGPFTVPPAGGEVRAIGGNVVFSWEAKR